MSNKIQKSYKTNEILRETCLEVEQRYEIQFL